MVNVFMTPRQFGVIEEANWNFHRGSVDNLRPYVSDNKYHMGGRETGHFGSGTYFSTYKNSSGLDKYRSEGGDRRFVSVGDGVYRVDLDIYKNLYKVRSKRQGDVLYTLLKNVNRLGNRIAYLGEFRRGLASYDNADLYQVIRANAKGLGLKCPSYYELTRMAQRLGMDQNDVRSLSTVFMEFNGYNGVDVSGVEYYDNTKHGSVIYDMSKIGGEVEEVMPKSLYTGYKDSPYDNSVVRDGITDKRIESLKGENAFWVKDLDGMPVSEAMRLLKNYTDSGNALDSYEFDSLNDDLASRYLRLLFVKDPNYDYWGETIIDRILEGRYGKGYLERIEKLGAYYWVNYLSKKSSGLIAFLKRFGMELDWSLDAEEENRMKKGYLDKLTRYLQRDLTEDEREYIDKRYYSI